MSLKVRLTKNVYVTSPRDADPFFRPRKYSQNKLEVIQIVTKTVNSLQGWKFEEYKEIQGRVRAIHRWFIGLGEEINVYVVQGIDGITTVEITSQSKAGKSDWGQNKRNVKNLLTALDQKTKP
ncbi:MAG TPA: DUF1499 domain-containing protein, partial [bacterium]|nr:DUF1499 domain-containing protein [bacterium]